MQENANVKFSTNSWHYKFMKYVLGSISPTPENMFNLCPYFWLLLFSLLFSPIIIPIKFIVKGLDKLATGFNNFMDNMLITPAATSWESKLSDIDAFQIYNSDYKISKMYKKAFGDENDYVSRQDFIAKWYKKKYKKSAFSKDSTFYNYKHTSHFNTWMAAQEKALHKTYDEAYAARKEAEEIKKEAKKNSFTHDFNNWLDKIVDSFSSWQSIILWTKRFVGLAITLAGLFITFVLVNVMGSGILWLVDNWVWGVVINVGYALIGIGILALLVWAFIIWIDYIADRGLTLWYSKAVYYSLYYVLFIPGKFIFYNFLFLTVGVNAVLFSISSAKLIWSGLLGFLGIFGEYFGASYSDYCPGIDWEEKSNNNFTMIDPMIPTEIVTTEPAEESTGKSEDTK